jgi:hypothetical protein
MKQIIIIVIFVGLVAIAYFYFNKIHEQFENETFSSIYFLNKYREAKLLYPNLSITVDSPNVQYTLIGNNRSGTTSIGISSEGFECQLINPGTLDNQYIFLQSHLIRLKTGNVLGVMYNKTDADYSLTQLKENQSSYPDVTIISPPNASFFRECHIEAIQIYPNLSITIDGDPHIIYKLTALGYTMSTIAIMHDSVLFAEIKYMDDNTTIENYISLQAYLSILKSGIVENEYYVKNYAEEAIQYIRSKKTDYPDVDISIVDKKIITTTPSTTYPLSTPYTYTKESVLSYLNQVDASMSEYLKTMFEAKPKCQQATTTTPSPTCPPVPTCLKPEPIECVADFGTNIGDKLSGGKGVLQDTRYVCPNTLKKCSHFKCGSAFGVCTSE